VERKTSASWDTDIITAPSVAGSWTVTPQTSYWTWIPFAQHSEVLANENSLSNGLSIMNSITNLVVNLPGDSTTQYTVSAEYVFNATLLFTRGLTYGSCHLQEEMANFRYAGTTLESFIPSVY
jgi:hypothetical protein